MLKILEEMLPVLVIPSSPHPFGLRSGVDLLVLLEGRGNKPPYERQVLRCVLGSHLTVVLFEGHVQTPVQSIFDLPLPTGRLKKLFGVGPQAGN